MKKYMITEKLSDGGTSDIHKGKKIVSRRCCIKVKAYDDVVIKIMKDSRQSSLTQFRQEYRILKKLQGSPYVPIVLDYFSSNGISTLVFPYKKCVDLFTLITEDVKRPLEILDNIFKKICLGLQHIHRRSVVHRDIKPENILFFDDGDVQIIDYGLSVEQNQCHSIKTCAGSVPYVAPEVVMEHEFERHFGKENDVWSLGIVCYTLYTQQQPYHKEDLDDIRDFNMVIKEDLLPNIISGLLDKIFVPYKNRIEIDQIIDLLLPENDALKKIQ